VDFADLATEKGSKYREIEAGGNHGREERLAPNAKNPFGLAAGHGGERYADLSGSHGNYLEREFVFVPLFRVNRTKSSSNRFDLLRRLTIFSPFFSSDAMAEPMGFFWSDTISIDSPVAVSST
jgi:hypothetical protein